MGDGINVFQRVTLQTMNKKNINIFSAILFVLLALAYGWNRSNEPSLQNQPAVANDKALKFYEQKISGEMVRIDGRIIKILADDNEGSRHQRFIVGLDSNLTILVAHNIDLAPRVPLQLHEYVEVFGQYEWNEKGGVVHWTHHDPNGTHAEGWIRYQDKLYQ